MVRVIRSLVKQATHVEEHRSLEEVPTNPSGSPSGSLGGSPSSLKVVPPTQVVSPPIRVAPQPK
jgi:hypothetical protein